MLLNALTALGALTKAKVFSAAPATSRNIWASGPR